MHIYDESTSRQTKWCVQINWSRELTFSERQINYIRDTIHHARGVYCIYAKDYKFEYNPGMLQRKRWSSVIYIGSGWLDDRLNNHLSQKKNQLLNYYLSKYNLGYRFDRIVDDDPQLDWPKIVEASLLHLFGDKYGELPRANRKREGIPELPLDKFIIEESDNFDFRS